MNGYTIDVDVNAHGVRLFQVRVVEVRTIPPLSPREGTAGTAHGCRDSASGAESMNASTDSTTASSAAATKAIDEYFDFPTMYMTNGFARMPNIIDQYYGLLDDLTTQQRWGLIARLSNGYYEGWRPTRAQLVKFLRDEFGVAPVSQ